jgi:hypothetical protein
MLFLFVVERLTLGRPAQAEAAATEKAVAFE